MGHFDEVDNVDPLGSEVIALLTGLEPAITPQMLLEIVTEKIKATLPTSLNGRARQNVLSFLIKSEYCHSIKGHIGNAVQMRLAGRWRDADINDNSDRVDGLISRYKAVAGEEGEDELAINQPVGPGGLTRLHLAAMDGEYGEVQRLVEQEKADPSVTDNLNKTPRDRARAFGHHRVAEYLESIMQKR